MPPWPIILLAALLIGYPLVQIAAIRLRRPLRLQFNARADRLRNDRSLSRSDRALVLRIEARSRGGFDTLQRWLRLPAIAFRSAFEANGPTTRIAERLSDNDEVELLRDEASALEWAAWPLAFLVAAPATFSAWASGAAIAVLLRGAATPPPPSLRALVKATIDDQRATA